MAIEAKSSHLQCLSEIKAHFVCYLILFYHILCSFKCHTAILDVPFAS